MNKQFVLFRFLHCFFFSHINQHLNILFFPVQSPKVGFTAILTHDVSNLGDNQVIIFDRVQTNVGNDYNPRTGVFTCRVPGLYVFYVHTLAEPGKHLETTISKNLNNMAYTYAFDKEYFSSGSNMAVMDLQVGDTVLIRSHGDQHDHAGSVIDASYTSFSGFLINTHK